MRKKWQAILIVLFFVVCILAGLLLAARSASQPAAPIDLQLESETSWDQGVMARVVCNKVTGTRYVFYGTTGVAIDPVRCK